MNHQELIHIGLGYKGSSLRYPFDPDLPVLFVCEKMFALFGHRENAESVNLKTNPEEAWLQREMYPKAVLPGYHMNKRHWNTVLLNQGVPDEKVKEMLLESYLLVVAKLTRAQRKGLA